MPINAGKIIIPAKELDKYWVANFNVVAGQVNGVVHLYSTLIPYNLEGDTGEPIPLDPLDVNAEVQVDPDALEIYVKVLAYIQKKAIEQGKIPESEEE
jgi:hypothetical protein